MAGELGEWVLVEGVGRADLRKPSWRRKLSPTASMSASFPGLHFQEPPLPPSNTGVPGGFWASQSHLTPRRFAANMHQWMTSPVH